MALMTNLVATYWNIYINSNPLPTTHPLRKKYHGYRGWKTSYGIFILMGMVTSVTLNKARLPICCMFLHYIPKIYSRILQTVHMQGMLYIKYHHQPCYLTSDITYVN